MNKDEVDMFEIGLYNMGSDYIEINESDFLEECRKSGENDIARNIIYSIVDSLITDEVRNFQINMMETFGIEILRKVWVKHLGEVLGTHDIETDFYAIINDKDIRIKNYKSIESKVENKNGKGNNIA